MAKDGGLRPFDRRGMRPYDELDLHDDAELFVLTMSEGNVEVRETRRGELVVWAYTQFVPMMEFCGNGQPFVRTTARELSAACTRFGQFVYVALDLVHPEGVRYPEPDWRDLEHLPLIDTTIPDTSMLWAPVRPSSVGTTRPMVEMVSDDGGGPVLLLYTSLARLRATLGERRAAVSFHADRLGRVISQVGAKTVAFDAAGPSSVAAPIS